MEAALIGILPIRIESPRLPLSITASVDNCYVCTNMFMQVNLIDGQASNAGIITNKHLKTN